MEGFLIETSHFAPFSSTSRQSYVVIFTSDVLEERELSGIFHANDSWVLN